MSEKEVERVADLLHEVFGRSQKIIETENFQKKAPLEKTMWTRTCFYVAAFVQGLAPVLRPKKTKFWLIFESILMAHFYLSVALAVWGELTYEESAPPAVSRNRILGEIVFATVFFTILNFIEIFAHVAKHLAMKYIK